MSEATVSGRALKFNYQMTPEVSVATTITGNSYDTALVEIFNGAVLVWNGTMIQTSDQVHTPENLQLGTMTMNKGEFSLTIPTNVQNGLVMMSAITSSAGNPPTPLNAEIARWTISGQKLTV